MGKQNKQQSTQLVAMPEHHTLQGSMVVFVQQRNYVL